MAHMFFIKPEQYPKIEMLFRMKKEGLYVVLSSANGYSDIAQWVDKYQNVKFVTVPSYKLDPAQEY